MLSGAVPGFALLCFACLALVSLGLALARLALPLCALFRLALLCFVKEEGPAV